MSSCTHPIPYGDLQTYEEIVEFFLKIEEGGYYNSYGGDEASIGYYETLCLTKNDWNCYMPDVQNWGIDAFKRYAIPAATFQAFSQMFAEQRF